MWKVRNYLFWLVCQSQGVSLQNEHNKSITGMIWNFVFGCSIALIEDRRYGSGKWPEKEKHRNS